MHQILKDANLSNQTGLALYLACKNGDLAEVKDLIEKKHINPHYVVDQGLDKGPVFKFAAESGNLDLVRYLFEVHSADIESRGEYLGTQDTALSRAASKGHHLVVEYLLSKGAQPNVLSDAIQAKSLRTVELLTAAGAIVTTENLYYAIASGELDIVRRLLKNGADINRLYIGPYQKVAVKSGNVGLVQFLKDEYQLDLQACNPDELLSEAVQSGSADMMRHLVDVQKIDVAARVTKENSMPNLYSSQLYGTILGKAVINGGISLLKYLFDELKLQPSVEILKLLVIRAKVYTEAKKAPGVRHQVLDYLQSFLPFEPKPSKQGVFGQSGRMQLSVVPELGRRSPGLS